MYEINVGWLIKNRVIIFEPVGDFEASKAIKVLLGLKYLLDKSIHRIHIVVDLTRVRRSMKDPNDLQNVMQRLRRHPRIGTVIFVAADPTLRYGVALLAQFLCIQFVVVDTFEQVIPIIKKLNTGLLSKTALLAPAPVDYRNHIE